MYGLIAGVIGYLLGSIAFSKIIVKQATGLDLTVEGSKNTGAMNSYETTGKKWIGIVVFLLDGFKGFLACMIVYTLFADSEELITLLSYAGVFAVIGHNFNLWLRMKGGRGLATAVGVLLFINPLAIFQWGIVWVISFFGVRKNVHVANALATIGAPIMVLISPDKLIEITTLVAYEDATRYLQLVAMLAFVILLKHIEPLQKLLEEKKLFSE
ncbi:MAG: glycerol-3-phosphate acyltransferase [Candidatus Kapaibacterium sp.]